MSLVEPPKRTNDALTLWTPEQATVFVNGMLAGKGGHYGPLLAFLLASGCRIAEALGLRWSDFDDKAETVKIERQLVEVWGQFMEGPPKTRSGVRTGFGSEAVLQMKERAEACRERQGADWKETGRIFTSDKGTPPSRSITINGVSVKVAQARAGHSSPQVTLRVYQHVLGDADRQAAEAIGRALAKTNDGNVTR